MTNRIRIETVGMRGMENDFDRLDSPEPYAYAKQRMNVAVDNIFAQTQAAVPEGTGDKRRPGGALRESGRVEHGSEISEEWAASIAYGYDGKDPIVNYAMWAWRKNLDRGHDFMAATEDPTDSIGEAMNAAFDDVFIPGDQ